jgi:hypothetical protein
MYKVTKDFQDGLTKEFHKAGDLIEVVPWRVMALGDYIEPVKSFKKAETEMLEHGENMILEKPKNKGVK